MSQVTPSSRVNLANSSKRSRTKSRKRKLPLTASMPGPLLEINLNSLSEQLEPTEDQVSEHYKVADFDEFTTPFLSSVSGLPVLPQKSVGHVKLCKLRNKSGHVSFATFKVYFSTSTRPLTRSEQYEVNDYDDLDTVVYYRDYKLPKNVHPHGHYMGHVVHHSKPGSTPESENDKRHCWVRVICAYCKIHDPEVISTCVVDMLHTGNNEKFRRHLIKYHPDIPMELSYQTLASRLNSQDFRQLLTTLMKLVVYERLPFSFVSSPHFVAFCRLLNPAINIPSSTQFVAQLGSFIQVMTK